MADVKIVFLFLSVVMDPLRGLNSVQLQDPLSKPLDLTKQISEALDLVKKKPSRSGRFLGSHGLRSPRSEFGYESASVPLNSTLLAHNPVTTFMTATENIQTDGVTGKVTKCYRAGEKRERNAAGFQDAPSSRSSFQIPLPNVETLSSECSRHGRAECISSDDSSVFEVPVSNGALLTHRVTENLKQEKERMADSSPIMIESDMLQDSDSLESRNVPSTSEAENADFKPTQNGSRLSSPSPSQKRTPETKKNRNQQRASAGKKATASAAKRRKKKKHSGISSSPSAFPSHEPEIKLKFASCKEEKREGRGSAFAPYVRMEFSACTVINFEEEGDVQVKTQRQVVASPGVVPTTSCLQLGRLGSESRHQTGELCCLCGRTANVAGLGDLHGPYHPKEVSTDLLTNGHEDSGAKRTRLSDERWVHEDCSIWSAGVFLVKGRLYGLDEAVRLAQETVSLYSRVLLIGYKNKNMVCRCSFRYRAKQVQTHLDVWRVKPAEIYEISPSVT